MPEGVIAQWLCTLLPLYTLITDCENMGVGDFYIYFIFILFKRS